MSVARKRAKTQAGFTSKGITMMRILQSHSPKKRPIRTMLSAVKVAATLKLKRKRRLRSLKLIRMATKRS